MKVIPFPLALALTPMHDETREVLACVPTRKIG
jgi:hypothetical protein